MDPTVHITCYTDPLCSWSWAFEPVARRLRYEYAEPLAWRDVMAGMLPDWKTFSDPLNDVGSPAQMAPHWFHVAQMSGQPIDEDLWHEDPPASSFPACLAVKAAGLQGEAAGERYLRLAREAAMLHRRNIARPEVLWEIAERVAAEGLLDAERFAGDLEGEPARDAFREDLNDARYRNIGRFPSLILSPTEGRAILVVGYRPYDRMVQALEHIAPGIAPLRRAESAEDYAAYWRGATPREIEEALCGAPAPPPR